VPLRIFTVICLRITILNDWVIVSIPLSSAGLWAHFNWIAVLIAFGDSTLGVAWDLSIRAIFISVLSDNSRESLSVNIVSRLTPCSPDVSGRIDDSLGLHFQMFFFEDWLFIALVRVPWLSDQIIITGVLAWSFLRHLPARSGLRVLLFRNRLAVLVYKHHSSVSINLIWSLRCIRILVFISRLSLALARSPGGLGILLSEGDRVSFRITLQSASRRVSLILRFRVTLAILLNLTFRIVRIDGLITFWSMRLFAFTLDYRLASIVSL